MTGHRWIAGLVALVLLAGACSSQAADDSSSGGGGSDDGSGDAAAAGGTPIDGVTDDTINVSFIGADFAALAEAGLAPDLGDMTVTIPALVDDINENGGIGGRQINLTVDLVDGTRRPGRRLRPRASKPPRRTTRPWCSSPPPSAGSSCAARPSGSGAMQPSGARVGTNRCYEEAEGRLFSRRAREPRWGRTGTRTGWANVLEEAGELEGKTIGVVTSEDFDASPRAPRTRSFPISRSSATRSWSSPISPARRATRTASSTSRPCRPSRTPGSTSCS